MDSLYLKYTVGVPLSTCIAELTAKRPADPIEWMSHWLYRYVDGEIYFYEKKLLLKSMQKMQLEIRRTHEKRHTHLNKLHHQIKSTAHEIHHNAIAMRRLQNKILKQKMRREKLEREEQERKQQLSVAHQSQKAEDKESDYAISGPMDSTVGSEAALFGSRFSHHEDQSFSTSASDDEIHDGPRFSMLTEVDGHLVQSKDNKDEILEMQKRLSKMMHPNETFQPSNKFRKFSNFMSPGHRHRVGSKVDPSLPLHLHHRQSSKSDSQNSSESPGDANQLDQSKRRSRGSKDRRRRHKSRTKDRGHSKDETDMSQLDMTDKSRSRRGQRRRRSRQRSEERDDGDDRTDGMEPTERSERRDRRRERKERGMPRSEERDDGDEQTERTDRRERRERRDRRERRERAVKPKRSRSRVSGEKEEWEQQISDDDQDDQDDQDDDQHRPIAVRRKPKPNRRSTRFSIRPLGTKAKHFRKHAKSQVSEGEGEQAGSLREEESSDSSSLSSSSDRSESVVQEGGQETQESVVKQRQTEEVKYRATWRVDCNLGLVCDHAILGLMQGRPPFIPPETPEAWEARDYIPESHYDHEIYSCSNTDVLETFSAMQPHVTYKEFIRKGSWLQAGYLVAMNRDVRMSYKKAPIISAEERAERAERVEKKHAKAKGHK